MENNNAVILAIDDINDNLITLKALLNDTFPHAIVFTANSGSRGLQLAKESNPDVILLDIIMPEMDGFEVCKKLKADETLRDIPIVFVTALKDDKTSRVLALELGAEAFLSKPIETSELIAQIRAMVKIREASRQRKSERERLNILVEEQTMQIQETYNNTLDLYEELKTENEARKRSEDALIINENRYKKAQQVAHVGGWEYDIVNNRFWGSDEGKRIYNFDINNDNFSAEQVMNCVIDKDKVNQAMLNLIQKDVPYNIEFEIIPFKTNDRRIIKSIAELVRDNNGNPIKVSGVMLDITVQKKNEEELRKLSQALRQSPASVIITDTNGVMVYVNPKLLEITGYTLEEVIGNNPNMFSSKEKPKEEYKVLWNTITSGHEWRGEFHDVKKNGELYWESASISPIFDEHKNIINYLAVKEDITEKKQIISELISSKDKAEHAVKLKDAFISNMSHEIRTPLNGILGMTSIVQEKYSNNPDNNALRIFEAIEKSSNRLINTVDEILDFSRLQVGEYKVHLIDVSVSAILQTLISDNSLVSLDKSLRVNFTSTAKSDIILADTKALTNAFRNLLSNAVKFTEEGQIDITVYNDDNNYLCVDFKDTGIGISQEYIPKLFEPYSQEGFGYNRPYEGLGLGLAIAQKLLCINSASISAKSILGKGTTFSVCFDKLCEGIQNEITEGTIVHHPDIVKAKPGSKPVILIVEDDVVNQMFLNIILKKLFTLEMASDAVQALNILAAKEVNLILMDISLKKGMNGLELTKEIRNSKVNPNIPIIAVTGHAFPDDERKAKQAGCDDYLAKPFKGSQLLEKVNKLVK